MDAQCAGDVQKYKEFVSGHRFDEMEGKRGVLVLGRMGSGKSTTISIQLGATYKQLDNGSMQLVGSKQWIPQTSDGWTSKTLQVQLYPDKDTGHLYLDTAGLNENRGETYRAWTSFSTAMVLSVLKEITAVLVTVDFGEAFGSRGCGLRELAQSLSVIVSDGDASDCIYQSMIFVFTNAFSMGKLMNLQMIMAKVTHFKEAEQKDLDAFIQMLHDQFGQRSMESNLATQIQWENVPERHQDKLRCLRSTVRLLDAMINSNQEGRCHCSFLPDARSCYAQCHILNRMIESTRGISKDQLKKLVAERVMKSLDVSNNLASIIQDDSNGKKKSYLSVLTERADLLEQLNEVCKRNEKQMSIIETGDWREVREYMRHEKEQIKRSLSDKKNQCETEKARLGLSQELQVLKVDEVRIAQTSGFLSWTAFGGGWAEFDYTLENVSEFDSYTVEGDKLTKKVIVHEPQKGQLQLHLESLLGCGLKADVKIQVKENKLPSSKQSIKTLEKQIQEFEEKSVWLEANITALKALTTKESFMDHVISEKPEVEGQLTKLFNELQRPIEPMSDLLDNDVLNALTTLLPLLQRTDGGISKHIAPGPRKFLSDFCEQCKRVEKLTMDLEANPVTKSCTRLGLQAVKQTPTKHAHESEAPVLGLAGSILQQSSQVLASMHVPLQGMVSTCEKNTFVAGAFMVCVASGVPYGVLGWYVSLLLRLVGVLVLMSSIAGSFNKIATRVMKMLTRFEEQCGDCMHEGPRLMQQTTLACCERFADKVQVKLKVDSSDFARSNEGDMSYLRLLGKFLGGLLGK